MNKIKMIVADDHAVVRMGLVALLESEKDIEVVGEAGDGAAAVSLVKRLKPDLVLMDLAMPRKDGAAATAEIKSLLPETKIVILTTFGNADEISRALDGGAEGALLKSADYSDVVGTIRNVAAGKRIVAPEIKKMLSESDRLPELTGRQREVLSAMCRGLTNADIAKILSISPDGVKFHITAILAKLGAANRSEAVAIALQKHLVKTAKPSL